MAFSGTNYWDDEVCQYTGTTFGCTGTSNLKEEYTIGGASYRSHNLPSLYRSDMSNTTPTLDYSRGIGYAQNTPYTIAYYVEEYINTLGINGTARLLTTNELLNVGCTEGDNDNYNCNNALSWFLNGYSFWLGNASTDYDVSAMVNNSYATIKFAHAFYCGVRPVIVLPTSDIQNS